MKDRFDKVNIHGEFISGVNNPIAVVASSILRSVPMMSVVSKAKPLPSGNGCHAGATPVPP